MSDDDRRGRATPPRQMPIRSDSDEDEPEETGAVGLTGQSNAQSNRTDESRGAKKKVQPFLEDFVTTRRQQHPRGPTTFDFEIDPSRITDEDMKDARARMAALEQAFNASRESNSPTNQPARGPALLRTNITGDKPAVLPYQPYDEERNQPQQRRDSLSVLSLEDQPRVNNQSSARPTRRRRTDVEFVPRPSQGEHWTPYEDRNEPDRPLTATALLTMMHKWRLSYGGTRGEDIEQFLSRIEEGRDLLNIRDRDLLKSMPFILQATALIWYRHHAHCFHTWEIFKSSLRARFSDPDYQIALREEIQRRTQGKDESVCHYISCMGGLFARLSPPWTEWEQVRITHRNMLSAYRLVIPLHGVETMENLELVAARQEQIFRSSEDYRAPPAPEASMFPALAYKPLRSFVKKTFVVPRPSIQPRLNLIQSEENIDDSEQQLTDEGEPEEVLAAVQATTKSRTSKDGKISPKSKNHGEKPVVRSLPTPLNAVLAPEQQPVTSQATTSQDFICWNCNKSGHRHGNCPEPRRLFYYRCREPGVKSTDCLKCKGGNSKA